MPESQPDIQSEVEEGQNKRTIKCTYCSSTILTPACASLKTHQWNLPLMAQKKDAASAPETEKIDHFWMVEDMFTFYNVGFSNTVENTKYLVCADCEAGPIGYHDITSKISYVALARVSHVDPK